MRSVLMAAPEAKTHEQDDDAIGGEATGRTRPLDNGAALARPRRPGLALLMYTHLHSTSGQAWRYTVEVLGERETVSIMSSELSRTTPTVHILFAYLYYTCGRCRSTRRS